MDRREIEPELLERWALHYLGRYASSAENLRRVLKRRVRRRSPEAAQATATLIDELVSRYREAGLLDDAAYAAGRVQSLQRRGESLRSIRARLAAKGVAAGDIADALSDLRAAVDPDLAAAGSGPIGGPLPPTTRANSAPLRGRASAVEWQRRCSLAPIARRPRR